jgi:HD-GYP domain-containing protein (c-di-GMP phosphodiesterase class II)
MDHPFWRSKFTVSNDAQLERIASGGVSELWIDTDKGLDVEGGSADTQQVEQEVERELEFLASIPSPLEPVLASENAMDKAARLIRRSVPRISAMFGEARLGKAIDMKGCETLVEEISNSVISNPEALISLVRLKSHDDYTYMHSVAVCALMIALGRQIGLQETLLKKVGLAGMLHDLGKALMPIEILNKPGKLSDSEFGVMRSHPSRGHALLIEGGGTGPVVLDVCLHHHEKVDGTGYPEGLSDDKISLVAKMGSVCDVYDAITSNRPYKRAWNPAEALRHMTQWKGHFDQKVFQAFVRTVGIYPVGSLVRLGSGRLAVVTSQNPQSLLAPRVKAFFSTKSNMRILPQEVNLASKLSNDKIVGFESPEQWKFKDLDELWGAPTGAR